MNSRRNLLLFAFAVLLVVVPAQAFAQTIVTVTCTGTATTDGAALLSAYSGVTGASATSPYVVQPEPCLYDIGTSTLTAKNFVDLIGLGRNDTIITSQVDRTSAPNSGTVTVPASVDAEFANLTIRNEDTTECYAVRNASDLFVMEDVILEATCEEDAVALYTNAQVRLVDGVLRAVIDGEEVDGRAVALEDDGGDSVVSDTFMAFLGPGSCTNGFGAIYDDSNGTLISANIFGGGCTNGSGIEITNGSSPIINASSASVDTTGGTGVGIDVGNNFNFSNTPQVFDTRLEVNSGGTAYGVRINKSASSVRLTNVTATTPSGSTRVGLQVTAGLAVSDRSSFDGSTNSLVVSSGATANVGASKLSGGSSSVSGTATCINSYDGSYSALGSTC